MKLSEHYAHAVVIGRETEDEDREEEEVTGYYLYCGDCDRDLMFERDGETWTE